MDTRKRVFLYGAYGHTGRFVAALLKRRGIEAILSGRDATRLASMAEDGCIARAASLDEKQALHSATEGCTAILNCAGPFADTADALIEEALRLGVPYLDVTGETDVTAHVFAAYRQRAERAGTVIVPAAGFYGGLGAVLAKAAARDWRSADEVVIAIGLDSWHPTPGTRAVIQRMGGKRLIFAGGELRERSDARTFASHRFPPPFGEQKVMRDYPGPEGVLLPPRLATPDVTIMMAVAALSDLRQPLTPPPAATHDDGSSSQRFLLDVQVRKGAAARQAFVSGRDIYATTAAILVSALELLRNAPHCTDGVFSLADIVEPATFLSSIRAPDFIATLDAGVGLADSIAS